MKKFPTELRQIFKKFASFKTPAKIQDFLGTLRFNSGDTNYSPLSVLKNNKAHCLEGAVLAAGILWYHGNKPLIIELRTIEYGDDSHVLALFKQDGLWGAISKTNHAVLRYRDPVYKSVRELAMSYFHEYFLDDGRKTLRSFSAPLDLSKLPSNWLTDDNMIKKIDRELDKCRHYPILKKGMEKMLRKPDKIEIEATKGVEWD